MLDSAELYIFWTILGGTKYMIFCQKLASFTAVDTVVHVEEHTTHNENYKAYTQMGVERIVVADAFLANNCYI